MSVPDDAISAIKTLPHITVDRMLGLWVSLDQVVDLLEGWREDDEAERLRGEVKALRDNLTAYFSALDGTRATSDPDEQAAWGAGVDQYERNLRKLLRATPDATTKEAPGYTSSNLLRALNEYADHVDELPK